MKKYILFIFIIWFSKTYSQLDSIQFLEEVVLTDAKLKPFSEGFKMQVLSDSLIKHNPTSLTEVLQLHSALYFKENGFGMVSSPSFRGTNAGQTAVIWNGLNINSIFTGQTDFNVISPFGYNEIAIRSGGGGVQYGSGAIGGSVHLNNRFSFRKRTFTNIGLGYGSFGTLLGNFKNGFSTASYDLNYGVNFIHSENNYDYIGKDKKNANGEFSKFEAQINAAKSLKNGILSWNSEYAYNDRQFSGSLTTRGKDGYKDLHTRNLMQLQNYFGAIKTTAKAAHLFEQFQYFPDVKKTSYDQGQAQTWIGSMDAEYFKNAFRFSGKMEYARIDAVGDNTGNHYRNTLAAVFLMKHQLSKNWQYALNFRQEFLNDYSNPLLWSADVSWSVTKEYAVRFNLSKNFRVPTFNDLFWKQGGNENLDPEKSYQVEVGQVFRKNNFEMDLALFYIHSKDMIKWVPVSTSLWIPKNIAEAQNYGAEVTMKYHFTILNTHKIHLDASYAYTKAEDMERRKQLIYVPYHKLTANLDYRFRDFSVFFQGLHNGKVFTTSDNSETTSAYTVFNMGLNYALPFSKEISTGLQIKNIFNTYYENVAYRPMPSRYLQLNINFNF